MTKLLDKLIELSRIENTKKKNCLLQYKAMIADSINQ